MRTGQAEPALNRVEEFHLFGNIKGILIFLMVFYHFYSNSVNAGVVYWEQGAYGILFGGVFTMLLLAAVPLFALMTGYYCKDAEACRNSAFSTLLIPYLVLMLAVSVFYAILQGRPIYLQMGDPFMQLWYLLSMFWWFLLLKDVARLRFAIPVTIVLSLLVNVYINTPIAYYWSGMDNFLSLSRTVAYFPFFLIGYKLKPEHLAKVRRLSRVKTGIVALIFVGLSAGLAAICFFADRLQITSLLLLKGDAPYYQYLGSTESFEGLGMMQCNLVGIAFRLVFYCIVLCAAILFLRLVPKKKCFLTQMGNAALTIYSLHVFLILPILRFVPSLGRIGNLLLGLAGTVVILFLLSRNIVHKTYSKLILRLGDAVFQKETERRRPD